MQDHWKSMAVTAAGAAFGARADAEKPADARTQRQISTYLLHRSVTTDERNRRRFEWWREAQRAARRGAGAVVCATVVAIASARAQQRVPPELVGASFEIHYGIVETVQASKMDATASTVRGAAIGGVVGLAVADHDDDARGAVKGAAAGALIARLVAKHQKDNAPNVYTYTVALVDGGESKIVSETGDIRQGDCVAVEYGQSANVRRMSNAYCESDHQEVARTDAAVSAQAQQSAVDCHTAKQVALQAKTEAEMDLALKKVRLFCEG